jgi:hypothetical protein
MGEMIKLGETEMRSEVFYNKFLYQTVFKPDWRFRKSDFLCFGFISYPVNNNLVEVSG